MQTYISLHNHSEYSKLDGKSSPKALATKAKEYGMDAIAITDHRNLDAMVPFYKACADPKKGVGIKPIIGCCLPGQPVYTSEGIKPIEDIQPGEQVLTHKGRYRNVVRTMTREYSGILYGFRVPCCNDTWLTDEHPIMIGRLQGDEMILDWIRADSVIAGRKGVRRRIELWNSFVAFPRLKDTSVTHVNLLDYLPDVYIEKDGYIHKQNFNKFDHETTTSIPMSLEITESFMRILGHYIAEGSVSKDSKGRPTSLRFTFGSHETNTRVVQVIDDLRDVFGVDSVTYHKPERHTAEVICNSTVVARIIASMCGTGCDSKVIPSFVYATDNRLVEQFVYGLTADAKISSLQSTLKITAKRVVWGTRLLLAKLGLFGKVTEDRSENKKPTYTITWTTSRSSTKPLQRFLIKEDYIFLPIYEIKTRHYIGQVHNLEVEEDNSYVTDFIVHNCEVEETEDRTIKSRASRKTQGHCNYHLVLLARNELGHKNLMKIVSDAATVGLFDRKERTDFNFIRQNDLGRGLFATTACIGGRVGQYILEDRINEAKAVLYDMMNLFDQVFLELQPHMTAEQTKVNDGKIKLARELNLPLIITCDSHYVMPEEKDIHDTLLCMQTAALKDDPNRFRFPPGYDVHLWNPEDMWNHVKKMGYPEECITNTIQIAKDCNVELKFNQRILPRVDVPPGYTPETYLKEICEQRIWEYLGKRPHLQPRTNEYLERLKMELNVIISKGYASYFLILEDFISFCKKRGIPVGPGRGSSAASIVARLLRITGIDPIEWGLTFERFLNPERDSMPDCKEAA